MSASLPKDRVFTMRVGPSRAEQPGGTQGVSHFPNGPHVLHGELQNGRAQISKKGQIHMALFLDLNFDATSNSKLKRIHDGLAPIGFVS